MDARIKSLVTTNADEARTTAKGVAYQACACGNIHTIRFCRAAFTGLCGRAGRASKLVRSGNSTTC